MTPVRGRLTARQAQGLNPAVLSNGTPYMLAGAVSNAGIGDALDAVLSVETVGVFKPNPAVYAMVGEHFGCARREVLFVSSNCWDACVASGQGFLTAWANRAGEPLDRLPWKPKHILEDLTTIPEIAAAA